MGAESEHVMGLVFRKSKRIGRNTRVNMSLHGVSVSRRIGPVTVNSRGHVTLHLAKGLSFRLF